MGNTAAAITNHPPLPPHQPPSCSSPIIQLPPPHPSPSSLPTTHPPPHQPLSSSSPTIILQLTIIPPTTMFLLTNILCSHHSSPHQPISSQPSSSSQSPPFSSPIPSSPSTIILLINLPHPPRDHPSHHPHPHQPPSSHHQPPTILTPSPLSSLSSSLFHILPLCLGNPVNKNKVVLFSERTQSGKVI